MDRGPADEAETLGRKPSVILSPPPDISALQGPFGTDGWESNPPQAVLETASPTSEHAPVYGPEPCLLGRTSCQEGRRDTLSPVPGAECADEDFHLVCGPHQSSTPATLPVLLCSSQPATLLHCLRLLGQHSPRRPRPAACIPPPHTILRLDCHTPLSAVFSGWTPPPLLHALARRRQHGRQGPIPRCLSFRTGSSD